MHPSRRGLYEDATGGELDKCVMEDLTGAFIEGTGFVIAVVKVTEVEKQHLLCGDPTLPVSMQGYVTVRARLVALVCRPVVNEVLDCVVRSISRVGTMVAFAGPLQVVFMDAAAATARGRRHEVDDIVRTRIVRVDMTSTGVRCIGEVFVPMNTAPDGEAEDRPRGEEDIAV